MQVVFSTEVVRSFPKTISFFFFAAFIAGASHGCGAGSVEGEALSTVQGTVVYGTDNRTDVYAYPVETWRNVALNSAVALVKSSKINMSNPDNVQFIAPTLQEWRNLCPGERFADQPTAAFCSGTLIDDNKVLTAGHCVRTKNECAATKIVFHYAMSSETQLMTVTSQDVFSCSKILTRIQSSTLDYAILQLDRPATPRFTPAPIRRNASAVSVDAPLFVIGSGSGLPLKMDDGGTVRDPRAAALDYFIANPDTFGGNSGSGVFLQDTGEVAGILVRGETDYVYDSLAGCYRVNVCAEDACSGEDSTYTFRAINALCSNTMSALLCSPFCGDGVCTSGESNATCPSECPVGPPPEWKCSPSYYNSGDGCHCNCGAYDPDCDVTPLPAKGCKKGYVCSSSGTCVKP